MRPKASRAPRRWRTISGAVLAAQPSGVLVGVPEEDVGSLRNAEAVTALGLRDTTPGFDAGRSWTPAPAGVVGAPEEADRFGAALAAQFGHVVVGVPVSTSEHAGMRAWCSSSPNPPVASLSRASA